MIPAGARVWIAMGHTDMRRGMQGLAAMVQQHFTKCHRSCNSPQKWALKIP